MFFLNVNFVHSKLVVVAGSDEDDSILLFEIGCPCWLRSRCDFIIGVQWFTGNMTFYIDNPATLSWETQESDIVWSIKLYPFTIGVVDAVPRVSLLLVMDVCFG